MTLGGRTFGRLLVQESGALMDGICVLMEKTPGGALSLTYSTYEDTVRRPPSVARTWALICQNLDFESASLQNNEK